jgi:hypothetical protein
MGSAKKPAKKTVRTKAKVLGAKKGNAQLGNTPGISTKRYIGETEKNLDRF